MNNTAQHYLNYIEVKESLVHGKGIFALNDIPEEKLVLIIDGEVIDGNECERREEEENNVYIFWNGDECYIDTNKTQKIKYINHDCDPNCYVDERDERSLNLITLRPVKAGEELTIDYGYEEIYAGCNCYTCRS
jgi:uncharacterized protein